MDTYYVKNGGNDSLDGLSEVNAWATRDKVNSMRGSFVAGDSILFNRGDTFTGSATITIWASGSAGLPITYGAYGTGADPIFNGRLTITSWSQVGTTNIWTATNTGVGTVNRLFIDGVSQVLGRFPKIDSNEDFGYNRYDAHVNYVSLTDNDLPDSPSYAGCQIAVRTTSFTMHYGDVTSNVGGVIAISNFPTSFSSYSEQWGYFFQNHQSLLTEQGEYAYDSDTSTISLYSTTDPNTLNIEISDANRFFQIELFDYITIQNIEFDSANDDSIWCQDSNYIIIDNNTFVNTGKRAVYQWYCKNGSISYNTIDEANGGGIYQIQLCDDTTIIENTVSNIGMVPGRTQGFSYMVSGIVSFGSRNETNYNTINNTGYHGISWRGDMCNTNYNKVSNACYTLADGGGIYTWNLNDSYPMTGYSNVNNNIVYNVGIDDNGLITSQRGTPQAEPYTYAIYIDAGVDMVNSNDNTMWNCGYSTIFYDNSKNLNYYRNNCINYYDTFLTSYDQNYTEGYDHTGCNYEENVYVVTDENHGDCISTNSNGSDAFFADCVYDNNCYVKPSDLAAHTVDAYYDDGTGWKGGQLTLAEWQSAPYNQDANSTGAPIPITTSNVKTDIVMEYNDTRVAIDIVLTAEYVDYEGTTITSPLTLQPFTSKILFKTGEIVGAPIWNGVITASNITANSVRLTWESATEGDAPIDEYIVQVNGSDLSSTTALTIDVVSLTPFTSYDFNVRAQATDAKTATSPTLTVTTQADTGIGYENYLMIITPNAYTVSELWTFKPIDPTSFVTWSRAGVDTSTRVNESGVLEYMGANVPRLNYNTIGGCPCILIEPEDTNLIISASDLDSWTYEGVASAVQDLVSPDGTTNAWTVVTGFNDRTISPLSPATNGVVYTAGCYIQRISTMTDGNYLRFTDNYNSSGQYHIDINAMPVGEWVWIDENSSYVTIVDPWDTAVDNFQPCFRTTGGIGVTVGVFLPQLTTTVTTPIPNYTAGTVTRPADIATATLPAETVGLIFSIDGVEQAEIPASPGAYQIPVGEYDYIKVV